MTWKNLFNEQEAQETVSRINTLSSESQPQWGKMNVGQMLAHCSVAYDLVYFDEYPKPGAFQKIMINLFAKSAVVGSKPYKRNGRTAPMFLISDNRKFDIEKKRLIDNLQKTQQLGASHFDGKESHAFGALSKNQWNTLFSKHLDHHLTQFGV